MVQGGILRPEQARGGVLDLPDRQRYGSYLGARVVDHRSEISANSGSEP